MKTKSFIKFFIGCTFLFLLSSCQKDKVTFTFTLGCSEDLLDFVEPSATYIDASGEKCIIKLSKSQFVKKDNSGSVEESVPVVYLWEKSIELKGTRVGQRDMMVSYEIRDNAPQIIAEKKYTILHKLRSSHSVESGVIKMTFNIGGGKYEAEVVEGSNLKAYLDSLVLNADQVYEIAK